MKLANIKSNSPKKIRDYIYKKFEVNPKTELQPVDKVNGKTFSSPSPGRIHSGFRRQLRYVLAIKNSEQAAVIYRPPNRCSGYYCVTWVENDKLFQSTLENLSQVKYHTDYSELYTFDTPRRKEFVFEKPQHDILKIKKFSTITDIEKICDYWEKVAEKSAQEHITQKINQIANLILSLEHFRDEQGVSFAHRSAKSMGTTSQRFVALEHIAMLEELHKEPYAPIGMNLLGFSHNSCTRQQIGLYPFVKANQCVKLVKNMIQKNTLEKLKG